MVRRTAEVELRDTGMLHAVLVQEGRAASGGRREVFTPGSVTWPSTGVRIITEHREAGGLVAFPRRDDMGRVSIRAKATSAIREAIQAGKRFVSVEFVALRERTTKGGVRELLSAFVEAAALTAVPEYDTTAAEVRERRRRVWL